MKNPLVRIGTRGSPMALIQAKEVKDRLARAHPYLADPDAIVIIPIKTTGDRSQNLPKETPLYETGGKGLFTKEIEEALLQGEVDIGMHCTKDMTTVFPTGLISGAFLPREDPRDVFISFKAKSIETLPLGAVVGTVGLRRQAQVLAKRPDLKVVPLRGNVDTRLKKLADGLVDATFLALAGLKRLGLQDKATAILETHEMLPAVGQGAICAQVRAQDEKTRQWVAAINDLETAIAITAERALLAVLDGSCRTPIAALGRVKGDVLYLEGLVAHPKGTWVIRKSISGSVHDAKELGVELGQRLKAEAPQDFKIPTDVETGWHA